MTPSAANALLEKASVPEHSVHFMQAMSGGEAFLEPARIDRAVVAAIRSLIPLAPLHNGPNLLGIETALDLFPGVPQVAVFDTCFHRTMPPRAFRYALPRGVYRDLHVRRYGFHGLSHASMARESAAFLGKPGDSVDLILDGGEAPGKVTSTVLSVVERPFRILREGAVTRDVVTSMV